jgi:hypothetical protein
MLRKVRKAANTPSSYKRSKLSKIEKKNQEVAPCTVVPACATIETSEASEAVAVLTEDSTSHISVQQRHSSGPRELSTFIVVRIFAKQAICLPVREKTSEMYEQSKGDWLTRKGHFS